MTWCDFDLVTEASSTSLFQRHRNDDEPAQARMMMHFGSGYPLKFDSGQGTGFPLLGMGGSQRMMQADVFPISKT